MKDHTPRAQVSARLLTSINADESERLEHFLPDASLRGGAWMPYATNDDLAPAIRQALPPHAQDIFRAAFNAAWDRYGRKDPGHREEIAHRVAWAAVKRRYHKVSKTWLPLTG